MKEEFLLAKLSRMSLTDKINQMIMIDYRDVLEMNVELERLLDEYKVGGFILFKSNVADFNQTKKLLDDIKSSSDIPMFVSSDQEGGRVQRLDERVGFDSIPPMGEVGATGDVEKAFLLGKKIGNELNSIGVNMDMAPVLDIFSNPENRVIADRSFGTDSETVKKMSFSLADGLQSEGVIPVGKHFPGHGDTVKDSHVDLPIVEKSIDELKQMELLPFIEAVRRKLPGIMVGHLAVPKITNNNEPASLSKVMISDLLREDIGYSGLVMPDSLKMRALTNYFTSEEIYLRCILAGNDIMLMPQNVTDAFNTIYRGVNDGTIPIEKINSSVYKILSTKFDFGMFNKEYMEYLKQINEKIEKSR